MSETIYAVFECTQHGDILRGIFASTQEGWESAIEYGEENFETFHVADPGQRKTGDGYIRKCHNVHLNTR